MGQATLKVKVMTHEERPDSCHWQAVLTIMLFVGRAGLRKDRHMALVS